MSREELAVRLLESMLRGVLTATLTAPTDLSALPKAVVTLAFELADLVIARRSPGS